MKRFVLTGGHGVGKTSLILALEQCGEWVIREAGGDLLRYRRALGQPFPTDEKDFEAAVLRLHIEREQKVPVGIRRVFIDRGRPDHLAYSRLFHWPLPAELQEAVMAVRYDAVFFIDGSSEYGVGLRPEAEKRESQRIAEEIMKVYQELNYTLQYVPPAALQERVKHILAIADHIASDGAG